MNDYRLQIIAISLLYSVAFTSVGLCRENRRDPNDVFAIGEQKVIEVHVPKSGFIGNPGDHIRSYITHRKSAIREEDFDKRYLRITVREIAGLKQGHRVVLQLDEIDPNGVLVTRKSSGGRLIKTLFYAYLDIKPHGSKMTGSTWARPRKTRDGSEVEFPGGILSRSSNLGLRFPLMLTCPPALGLDKTLKSDSWMLGDDGVFYTESKQLQEAPHQWKVSAILLRKVYPFMEVRQEDVKYYSDKDKALATEKVENSEEVIIHATETQFWKTPNDWLWQEMERTDGKGNITMRCKQISIK